MRIFEIPGRAVQVVLILILALGACSEREDPLRDFGLVPNIVDTLHTVVIASSNLDGTFQKTRNNGSQIVVGNQSEAGGEVAESKALLRFGVSAVPAGATVLADTLFLHCPQGGDYGDPVLQTIGVERITAGDWFADPSQGWPFDSHVLLEPPVTAAVGACDSPSTAVEILLPAALVAGWVAAPDSNFGLALVAAGSGGFKRFAASGGAPPPPVLGVRYVIGAGAEADTIAVRLALTEHATLTEAVPGATGSQPFALVGGPFDFRSVVRFDLSSLPRDASLNHLRLTLHLDPALALAGDDSSLAIDVHEVLGLPDEGSLGPDAGVTFVAAVADTATVRVAADTTVTINVTALGRAVERGILLEEDGDFPDLDRFGFVTREGALENRPRLEVIYTLPARIRL